MTARRSPFQADLLKGQVALVTGGATRLGLEISRVLGNHGARVAICSRKQANLQAAVAALRQEGIEAVYGVCDIRRYEEVTAVVEEVLRTFGQLDVVVNNAAGNFPAPISGLSPNGFKAVVDVDLQGTFNVSKAAYELWLRDHGGAVVNISAATQYRGMALQAHVVSAKAGIDALSRASAIEWGPDGVRVNIVAPGAMSGTEGVKRIAGDDRHGTIQNPLRRRGSTKEVAEAVLFLAGGAASYITGATLVVDGGGWLTASGVPDLPGYQWLFTATGRHFVVAAGPRSGEDVNGYLLVSPVFTARVVEVHDARRGVDTGYHDGVVGLGFAVGSLVLDRFAPDEFGVDGNDHFAALGQIVLECRHARRRTGLGGAFLIGVRSKDAVVCAQCRFILKRGAAARVAFFGFV